jgi:hypothetical protein
MIPRNPIGMNPGNLPENPARDNHAFVREVQHIEDHGEEPNVLDRALMSPEVTAKILTRELDGMAHVVASIFILLGEKGIDLYDNSKGAQEAREVLRSFEIDGDLLTRLLETRDALRSVEEFLRKQMPHREYIARVLPEVERYQSAVTADNNSSRKAG